MKKIVIFVALIFAIIFFNCKDKTLLTANEQMEKTEIDSITVKDGVKTNEVAPEVVKKDSVTINPKN